VLRHGRLPALGIVLAAALVLVSCGANTQPSAARRADKAISERLLIGELTVLHQALAGSKWQQIGSASSAELTSCRSVGRIHAGLTARAISPSFYARGVELRVANYVYARPADAQRALSYFDGTATEACRARTFIAYLRESGATASPARDFRVSRPQIGEAATNGQMEIPSVYIKGRSFIWTLDSTAARQGRVVTVLGTMAGSSTTKYNESVMAVLVKLAAAVQQPARSHTIGRGPSWGRGLVWHPVQIRAK
jgi:hypothetical protein